MNIKILTLEQFIKSIYKNQFQFEKLDPNKLALQKENL